jgi:transcriptional regulator with XRE-family HTH domain
MGEHLRTKRLARGLSQQALCFASGVPLNTVRSVEKDRHMPRLDTAVKLARALGCSVEEAFGLDQGGQQES